MISTTVVRILWENEQCMCYCVPRFIGAKKGFRNRAVSASKFELVGT